MSHLKSSGFSKALWVQKPSLRKDGVPVVLSVLNPKQSFQDVSFFKSKAKSTHWSQRLLSPQHVLHFLSNQQQSPDAHIQVQPSESTAASGSSQITPLSQWLQLLSRFTVPISIARINWLTYWPIKLLSIPVTQSESCSTQDTGPQTPSPPSHMVSVALPRLPCCRHCSYL